MSLFNFRFILSRTDCAPGVYAPVPWEGWPKIVIFWGVHNLWACKLLFRIHGYRFPTLEDGAGVKENAPKFP